MSTGQGGFAKGKELWLRESAEGNRIQLRVATDPLPLLTDEARMPTNELSWTGPPAAIRTVTGEAGVFLYTQRLFPAVVTILEPESSRVTFERGGDRVGVRSTERRELMMSVGDRLRVEGKEKPVLRMTPMKSGSC